MGTAHQQTAKLSVQVLVKYWKLTWRLNHGIRAGQLLGPKLVHGQTSTCIRVKCLFATRNQLTLISCVGTSNVVCECRPSKK